jgi:autotransporter-associated beta strand protein
MKSWNRSFSAGAFSAWLHALLLTSLFGASVAVAQDGYWINSGGGSWANAGNWDPADGIAGGADNTAYFGFVREAAISPNATFTISGAQTIGNLCFTTQGGASSWTFNSSAGGSLTMDATFGSPEITVTSPSLQVSLNVLVAGGGGVEKDGPGTLALAAHNTYQGPTVVNDGELYVNGLVGTGGVNVSNGTLGGTGVIMGPVVMGSGGALSLGNQSGPLTINNSLVLLPGSTTTVTLNSTGKPAIQGLSSVAYGGTLVINNLSGPLSLGESFSIFGGAPASGNFSAILPSPGPWLRWSFNPATGQVSVVSSASQPVFSNVNLAGTRLVCQLTAGPPGSPCYIMATTNLSQPMAAWTRIATNTFDMGGSVICTNDFSGNGANQVYLTAFVIPSP